MFTIRPYEEQDRDAVASYIHDLLRYECQIDPGRSDDDQIAHPYLEYLLSLCTQTDGTILVLETANSEHQVGGYICILTHYNSESMIDIQPIYAAIPDFYIHPAYRGKGASQALFAAAEQWAIARGATLLKLNVLAGNTKARNFYRKSGFSEHEIQLCKSLVSQQQTK